jgi:S-adenosylmethionine uptake transporter
VPVDHINRAMLFMVIAALTLPGIDAIAKFLSPTVSAGQVTWSRFFFQALLMLPLAMRTQALHSASFLLLWVHLARGALLALATLLFFHALKFLPIADAISIFFVEPLLLTLLSAWLLSEPVGWRRISAVLVGLAGSALVIQPNFASVGLTALLPLGTALCFAFYLLLTRKFAAHQDAGVMQFYAGVFGCVTMTIALLCGDWYGIAGLETTLPNTYEWTLLLGLSVIATGGHLLIVAAFRKARASILAPFQYLEIVSATLLGWIFFADFPDVATWLGIGLIIASGLYVFHRERVRGVVD